MKKKLFSLAVIIICLSITSMGTYAYFTAEKTAHNIITTGNIDIELAERTAGFTITGVMPGTELNEEIKVVNTGANAAWVRVKLDKSITLAQAGTPDMSLIQIHCDSADWVQQGEYYYYTHQLQPGTTTAVLNTQIAFDKTMGNLYQNSTAKIDICVQATQVANNGTTVLEAQGWPE
ncbi:MAG: hypothetical protein IJD56_03135 [Peptococcaceae bacterium]|nr:hypothetical protein [Peptococcaceae bacterium]